MAFPDVTGLLRTGLDAAMSVPVVVDIPRDRATEFVQVRRVGGTAAPPVRDVANLDIKTWAAAGRSERATELLLQAREYIWGLPTVTTFGATVYRVSELMGPKQINDPETGFPMGWMTVTLQIRADSAIMFTN